MAIAADLLADLQARGVIVHAPAATVITDVPASHFEAGVEIFPGTTIRGALSRFGKGTLLGKAGGGYFENVVTGRGVDLYGGYFEDCCFLDGVTLRGHAEVRGGTLLEEGCEAAHHVGYKMTIQLPWVVAGSLINFCDVLMAGGTSRKNHSEIGSSLALYNFTPWGDKHASLFGDVPRGVFQREAPVFVGGQTQIVSPVIVGFGAVIPAGYGLRRNVPDGQMYGETPAPLDRPFDANLLGVVVPKVRNGLIILGNIVALKAWYTHVRLPRAKNDAHLKAVYTHAVRQLDANIAERVKRLRALIERVPASRSAHQAALDARADDISFAQRYRRLDDHDRVLAATPALLAHLDAVLEGRVGASDAHISDLKAVHKAFQKSGSTTPIEWLRDSIDDAVRLPAQTALQTIVDAVSHTSL